MLFSQRFNITCCLFQEHDKSTMFPQIFIDKWIQLYNPWDFNEFTQFGSIFFFAP